MPCLFSPLFSTYIGQLSLSLTRSMRPERNTWCLMVRYGCVCSVHGYILTNPGAQLLALFAVLPPLLSTARLIYGFSRAVKTPSIFFHLLFFLLLPGFLLSAIFFSFVLWPAILYLDYVLGS